MRRDHGQPEAERIIQEGLQGFGLSESDPRSPPGSDQKGGAISGTIHESTTTLLGWRAKRLQMKSAANVSQQLIRGGEDFKTESRLVKLAI
jgi:hypothetical protein